MTRAEVMEKDDLQLDLMQQRVAYILEEARKQGASSAEADVSIDHGISVDVRLGEVETLEHHRDHSVSITVYKGRCKGAASCNDFNEAALKEAVRRACSIANYTASDAYAGLADADRMATKLPDLDLYHPWTLPVDDYIELARQTETAALAYDKRISNSDGASVNSHTGASVYGNTHGFIGGYGVSRHSLSCMVIAGDKDKMQRSYWYSTSRVPDTLETPQRIGEEAARRTLKRLGARKLATGKSPVLFIPETARAIVSSFVAGIRGSSIYRKASFLLDKKGTAIFPAFVHIHEQPHLLRAVGSAPFDNEGVATYARDIVSEGVLQEYVLESYAARKLGLQTTANAGGVRNLIIDPGKYNDEDLIKKMHKGLVVTEMMGHGINMVTGDFSQGASGFWVENGEIQYPVEEITIAGNLKDMFLGIQEIGNDVDTRSNIRVGSLLIEQMTIAGD